MNQPAILTFGELLWDAFADEEHIGGAPFNVAAHAVGCGLAASLYTRLGNDARGGRARAELARRGVDPAWVQTDSELPTGHVDVRLDAEGQPTYEIAAGAAWDAIEPPGPSEASRLRDAGFSALVFGTLAQRTAPAREALRALRRTLPGVPAVYDVNLRPPHTPLSLVWEALPETAVLKVNAEEATALARDRWAASLSPAELFLKLRTDFGTRLVILTRGAKGCLVLSGEGVAEVPAFPTIAASAVGAGDAFLAAFLAGWLKGSSPAAAARQANRVGAWVASRREAVPDYPPDRFGFPSVELPCSPL